MDKKLKVVLTSPTVFSTPRHSLVSGFNSLQFIIALKFKSVLIVFFCFLFFKSVTYPLSSAASGDPTAIDLGRPYFFGHCWFSEGTTL